MAHYRDRPDLGMTGTQRGDPVLVHGYWPFGKR
jgi:hypothetical protein